MILYRLVRAVVVPGLLVAGGSASAQPLSANPFLTASEILASRPPPAEATLRVVYRTTVSSPDGGAEDGELTILAAPDWALVTGSNGANDLHDFRLGRVFQFFGEDEFVSVNALGPIAGRAFELTNRHFIRQTIERAGLASPTDACDDQSELGLIVPGLPDQIELDWSEEGAVSSLSCNGRVIGSWTEGSGEAPPETFWLAFAAMMHVHPEIFASARAGNRVPAAIEASFKAAGPVESGWVLVESEAASVAYPLTPSMSNVTTAVIDGVTISGFGDLAMGAVAGTAAGGPPSQGEWDERLRGLRAEAGLAAAMMETTVSLMMFPDLGPSCQRGGRLHFCTLIGELRSAAALDPAVRALFDIGQAEQRGQLDAALQSMVDAQQSELADHPVLGASFALALEHGGEEFQTKAATAGLPSDPILLQVAALEAYPYQPAYWTDLGDGFSRRPNWPMAVMFYDIAMALPIPGAAEGASPVIDGRRALLAQMRSDFAAFFLSAPAPVAPRRTKR